MQVETMPQCLRKQSVKCMHLTGKYSLQLFYAYDNPSMHEAGDVLISHAF